MEGMRLPEEAKDNEGGKGSIQTNRVHSKQVASPAVIDAAREGVHKGGGGTRCQRVAGCVQRWVFASVEGGWKGRRGRHQQRGTCAHAGSHVSWR